MRVLVLLVLVLLVTGVKQSQLLVLRLSLEFDNTECGNTGARAGLSARLPGNPCRDLVYFGRCFAHALSLVCVGTEHARLLPI